jgi:hypothetical protein
VSTSGRKGSLFISFYNTKFAHITGVEDFLSPPFYYMQYSKIEVGESFISLYNTEFLGFPGFDGLKMMKSKEILGNPSNPAN